MQKRRINSCAIIPARGGSKSIHKKNLSILDGETLIGRCIDTVHKALIDVCFVSTDDAGIAYVAEKYGAIVLMRPDHLCGDEIYSHNQIVPHVIEQASERYVIPDVIHEVYCTAPLLTPWDIRNCQDAYREDCDVAVLCTPFHGVVFEDSNPITFRPGQSTNRQDRPKQWISQGGCFVFSQDYLRKPWMSGKLRIVPAEIPIHCDIDSPEDLEYARLVVRRIQSERTEATRNRHYPVS